MKSHLQPVEDFTYHEILIICSGIHNGVKYSHAGAFIRREITSRNKYKKGVEVSYYDSNLNTIFAIGGFAVAQRPMDWDIFKDYELVKVYALKERPMKIKTEQDLQHL